jgi:hypothetical protein
MADEQEDPLWAKIGRKEFEKGSKKYAKHRVRVNTKKHAIYPKKKWMPRCHNMPNGTVSKLLWMSTELCVVS